MDSYKLTIQKDKAGVILYCVNLSDGKIFPDTTAFMDGNDIMCQPYKFNSKEDAWIHWQRCRAVKPELKDYVAIIE